MATPPARTRVRRTTGSQTLGAFIDRHGLRPVSVYIPVKLHRALTETAIEAETTLQALITMACNTLYGTRHDLPPLVAPTRTKQDPHKSFTWYADIDLHKRMKMLAVDLDGTVLVWNDAARALQPQEAEAVRALHPAFPLCVVEQRVGHAGIAMAHDEAVDLRGIAQFLGFFELGLQLVIRGDALTTHYDLPRDAPFRPGGR